MYQMMQNALEISGGTWGGASVGMHAGNEGVVHPGQVIRDDVLGRRKINAKQLAQALNIHPSRLSGLLRGRHGITADMALRLSRLLGTTAEYWMTLQIDYELRVARRNKGRDIEDQVGATAG
jgi:antitoxin HigA-1